MRNREEFGPATRYGRASGRPLGRAGFRVSLVVGLALVSATLAVLPALAQDAGTDPGLDEVGAS